MVSPKASQESPGKRRPSHLLFSFSAPRLLLARLLAMATASYDGAVADRGLYEWLWIKGAS